MHLEQFTVTDSAECAGKVLSLYTTYHQVEVKPCGWALSGGVNNTVFPGIKCVMSLLRHSVLSFINITVMHNLNNYFIQVSV